MRGSEMLDQLRALMAQHGDQPVFDEEIEPINSFRYVSAEDADGGESSVLLFRDESAPVPITASALIAAYTQARDSSASNADDPWDDLHITNDDDMRVPELIFTEAGRYVPEDPAGFAFDGNALG